MIEYPNETLFYQIVIFLFTFFVLRSLVFLPVLRLLAKRRELTVGAERAAEELNAKTQHLIEVYQQKMQEARLQGLALKEKYKKEGEIEAKQIMTQAHLELEQTLEKARQEITRQSQQARLALRRHIQELSLQMAEKLLGRKVSA